MNKFEKKKAIREAAEASAKERIKAQQEALEKKLQIDKAALQGQAQKKLSDAKREAWQKPDARAFRREIKRKYERNVQLLLQSGLSAAFVPLVQAIGGPEALQVLFKKGRTLDEEDKKDLIVINKFEKKKPGWLRATAVSVIEFAPQQSFLEIPGEVRQLWHGTGMQGSMGITDKGFALPKWGGDHLMLGPGIYTAPSISKASAYIQRVGTEKSRPNTYNIGGLTRTFYDITRGGYGWLWLADVKLGNVIRTNNFGAGRKAFEEVKRLGGDSAFAEAGQYVGSWRGSIQESEYATYSENRIHARYLFILKYDD